MTSSLKLFKILYYIKQIDSKLPCVYSVLDHRGCQNVVRTLVTHSAAPRVPLFCSYQILMSSVIYYWADARQLGIYLLTMSLPFSHALDRLTVFTSEFLSITSISLVSLYPQSIAESAPSRNKLPNPGTSLGTEMSYWLTFLRPPTTSIVISIAGRRNYGRFAYRLFAYRLFAYVQHVICQNWIVEKSLLNFAEKLNIEMNHRLRSLCLLVTRAAYTKGGGTL